MAKGNSCEIKMLTAEQFMVLAFEEIVGHIHNNDRRVYGYPRHSLNPSIAEEIYV